MSAAPDQPSQWEDLDEGSEGRGAGASDQDMMEAPVSPPEHQAPFSPSFSPIAPNSSQQASISPRANGDKAAKVDFGAPGSSWNNKKFNDDFERAESSLLDRNWDHSKYGDPLLVMNTGS